MEDVSLISDRYHSASLKKKGVAVHGKREHTGTVEKYRETILKCVPFDRDTAIKVLSEGAPLVIVTPSDALPTDDKYPRFRESIAPYVFFSHLGAYYFVRRDAFIRPYTREGFRLGENGRQEEYIGGLLVENVDFDVSQRDLEEACPEIVRYTGESLKYPYSPWSYSNFRSESNGGGVLVRTDAVTSVLVEPAVSHGDLGYLESLADDYDYPEGTPWHRPAEHLSAENS